MRNVLLKLLNVISVLIIICSIAALLTVVMAKPGQAPNFFGFSLFRVMTGSMEPNIPTNSLIVVKRVPAESLEIGDVITFYSRDPSLMGEPNTHRIVRFEEGNERRIIYTKGDANNIEDRYPTRDDDLIGKVVFASLGLGNFVRLVSNPVIFIPLIVLPLVYMLGRSIFDSVAAAKKLAKEEEEAAVREALAMLREKRKADEAGNDGAGNDKVGNGEAGAGDDESGIDGLGKKTEFAENGQVPDATYVFDVLGKFDAGNCRTEDPTRNWRQRYGVRQRSQKRRDLNGSWAKKGRSR